VTLMGDAAESHGAVLAQGAAQGIEMSGPGDVLSQRSAEISSLP